MKALFILSTLLSLAFTQPSFASRGDVIPSVLRSFQSTFTTASQVEWSISQDMYKARFELNGQIVCAWYNFDGDRVAVTRNITSHQLPLTLQANLKKEYGAYWITDLLELNQEEGTTYYVTLENAENKLVLQSVQSNWSLYNKSKKE